MVKTTVKNLSSQLKALTLKPNNAGVGKKQTNNMKNLLLKFSRMAEPHQLTQARIRLQNKKKKDAINKKPKTVKQRILKKLRAPIIPLYRMPSKN
jgi:hypothetical protein